MTQLNSEWPAYNIKPRLVVDLKPSAVNARVHDEDQITSLVALIKKFGWTMPVLVDEVGEIIAGHGRVLAAEKMGLIEVPVATATDWTEAQKRAYRIADNRVYEMGSWDDEALGDELSALGDLDFDMNDLHMGVDDTEENDLPPSGYLATYDEGELGSLQKRYLVPPFTVLDTKQGYWQQRRKAWIPFTGNLSETKEGVLSTGVSVVNEINDGSSNFDPMLAEVMYRWFCPVGGSVLDPFGGEQTKGVVAGHLGLNYSGCEIRADQVEVNKNATKDFAAVEYHHGDSTQIDTAIKKRGFNMCFTSPPYYDLEVYSKEDMSALGTYEEFMDMYRVIFEKCAGMMADDSIFVVKVGEIRNKKTKESRGFIADNIKMFQSLGMHFLSEFVLLNMIGTGAMRANMSWPHRYMIRTHQNVLVFVKGDKYAAIEKLSEDARKGWPELPFEHKET